MSTEYEKKGSSSSQEGISTSNNASSDGFYDPSKESIWTRLGVTFESFKRAPGTTGCVHHLAPGVVCHHAVITGPARTLLTPHTFPAQWYRRRW